MKMTEYLYGGIFTISIVLIYFAYKQYSNTQKLISTGVKTTAKVIDLIEKSSDDGYTYMPVFEYTDRYNNKITFESKVSSSPPAYYIDQQVKIIHSKDNDDQKIISFWGLYRWTIILLSVAAPMVIIGGGYLLYSKG